MRPDLVVVVTESVELELQFKISTGEPSASCQGITTSATRWLLTGKYNNLTTHRVCKVCNEGWLEQRIEAPTLTIATPLSLGEEQTPLNVAAQTRLAAWAAKIAMRGRYGHEPPEPLDDDWLDHVYSTHEAPLTWHIFTTGYTGRRPVLYANRDITLRATHDPRKRQLPEQDQCSVSCHVE